jgi:hypothetical protein
LTPSEAGQTLLDDLMLNVVLVLVFATSILGPALTERFALRAVEPAPALSKRSSEIKGGPID